MVGSAGAVAVLVATAVAADDENCVRGMGAIGLRGCEDVARMTSSITWSPGAGGAATGRPRIGKGRVIMGVWRRGKTVEESEEVIPRGGADSARGKLNQRSARSMRGCERGAGNEMQGVAFSPQRTATSKRSRHAKSTAKGRLR